VCNQPRKNACRANPDVKLIIPQRLNVPQKPTMIDLSQSSRVSIIELKSNSGAFCSWDDQEETEPNVLEWKAAHNKETTSYEATRKFQESWAAKLVWIECVKVIDGLYDFVKCTICSIFEVRDKILMPKWDTLKKHGGKKKAKHDLLAYRVKQGQWYITVNCKHLVNERR
jgi:hypothetical protein